MVWGKVKGYSLWPGRIVCPPTGLKRPKQNTTQHCVQFFETNNFSWLKDHQMKLYKPFRDNMTISKGSGKSKLKLQKAIVQADSLRSMEETNDGT